MRFTIGALLALLMIPATAAGHHGVASLGAAGLEGPGAPLETSSSATLPAGSVLAYMKLDQARFETYTQQRDDEGDVNSFWMFGVGYGVRSWLSLYLFAPFYAKKTEDNSYTTSGFADLSLTAVVGFKFDRGLRLAPKSESLDDQEDWHFTLYGGLTLPTGDANIRDVNGDIDPGMSLGFGRPSYSFGFTTTKTLGSRTTWVLDSSVITFSEYEYDDGSEVRFGDEYRVNTALVQRLLSRGESQFRLDANLEGNFLQLGRDESSGIGERATGGRMIYVVPGLRFYYKSASIGVGAKVPAWTDLNEEDEQQGAEGKEEVRVLFTFSTLL